MSKMRKTTVGLVAAVLAAAGLYVYTDVYTKADCVTVYVDYGTLSANKKVEACIPVSGETNALDLLATAGFQLEGTRKYGNAVVCRVNNLPGPDAESCEEMPPAEAYWAVLIKEHELLPIPFNTAGEWGWAQTGINEVYLHPGDAIGLVFANDGEVKFP
jgi:hypothetical protein